MGLLIDGYGRIKRCVSMSCGLLCFEPQGASQPRSLYTYIFHVDSRCSGSRPRIPTRLLEDAHGVSRGVLVLRRRVEEAG